MSAYPPSVFRPGTTRMQTRLISVAAVPVSRSKPNDQFKFVVGALYQRAVADGLPENLPLAGDYVQSRMTQERLKDSFQLYNATATVDLDVATITSATAYLTREQLQSRDVSAYFLGGPIVLPDDNKSKSFSQEIRVATNPDKPWSDPFLVAFSCIQSRTCCKICNGWAQPDSRSEYAAVLTGTSLGPDDIFYRFTERNKADQLAAFGEIAVKPVDTVRISAGLRIAKFERTTSGFAEGALNGGTDSISSRRRNRSKHPISRSSSSPIATASIMSAPPRDSGSASRIIRCPRPVLRTSQRSA